MERREFLRSLTSAPMIARPTAKNRREHHQGERIYHGPIRLPSQVLDIALRAPVYRTTHRHPVIRLQLDGVTYLFRSGIAGDCYLGEIVRTPEGRIRVHAWAAIETAPALNEILARKIQPTVTRSISSYPILPPMRP